MKNKFITVYKIIDINSEYQKPAYPSLNENEKKEAFVIVAQFLLGAGTS